ncbi:PA2779 family protein [Parahaliea aestuarii]|uniref:PA2779 family protein n=1 Tax=Parahaliea aestuarii TaxID=1852021 RepID=A0A5C9A216_9GAMM|nr:PA2779 family protein [Parahaliea aestuarii]TXS94923.1 hypothetical protein FVW59_03200 [Parahaliea aestuarii]
MITARILMLFQALILVCATTATSTQAAVISTPDYVSETSRDGRLAQINAVLARDEVRQQLVAMGVSHEDAMARVAALSPAELQQLGQRMEQLPAGGDILGLIGAVFVVLLILELVGVTNIFTAV